ncbi:MerR family transcriptional regulator [uncultured Sphingomonas sp.]|uniref:MerR family transcriptional regulator n=1 Tax=uncultured Sphingomonas sp. TaxID=158754 RepID=UPI0025DB4818|nr:MerR family transcriptional regulator [uncultured Sphingomonas sp.]
MAEDATPKGAGAFRTIGEVSAELNLPQHILRYWETRFPQLRPLQRAGNRRYYRPADVELVRRIDRLLNREGYTVKGVRKLLDEGTAPAPLPAPEASSAPAPTPPAPTTGRVEDLRAIRALLIDALTEDERLSG